MSKFIVLLVFKILFATIVCCSQVKTINQTDPIANDSVINSLVSILNTYYVLPDQGKAMANALIRKMKAGEYISIHNPSQLAERLENDAKSVYADKHLSIFYDPDFEQIKEANELKQGKIKEFENELVYERTRNFMFTEVKVLPRNIGYIQINGFSDYVEQAEPTATAAFGFLANTRAIIVDLRFNGGGNPEMVKLIESYFFGIRTHMSDIYERFSNITKAYYTDPEQTKGIILNMPIYILTSKRTFSAGEDFSYSMQQIKRALVVGDTTAGGAHPTRPFSLKSGLVAEIPYARSINPYSSKNWEGSGVIPDLPVHASRALEKALEAIYLKELTTSIGDKEISCIQWQINALKASSGIIIPMDTLEKFCGEYQGGLKIYLKNNILYCRNAERNNDDFKLVPINTHLFILDENVQVEFIEEKGKHNLRMIFIDGNQRDKTRL